jgi:hypothetical protein
MDVDLSRRMAREVAELLAVLRAHPQVRGDAPGEGRIGVPKRILAPPFPECNRGALGASYRHVPAQPAAAARSKAWRGNARHGQASRMREDGVAGIYWGVGLVTADFGKLGGDVPTEISATPSESVGIPPGGARGVNFGKIDDLQRLRAAVNHDSCAHVIRLSW